MLVVSDTSPILNLAIIGRLSLLNDQFGKIWIPNAVLDELRSQEDLPGSQEIRVSLQDGWLGVKKVQNYDQVKVLARELDRGEAEAIALALEMKAEWILVDEKEARRICKAFGLRVTGVLGILLRARAVGKIGSLAETIEELRVRAGFRVGKDILDEILKNAAGFNSQ